MSARLTRHRQAESKADAPVAAEITAVDDFVRQHPDGSFLVYLHDHRTNRDVWVSKLTKTTTGGHGVHTAIDTVVSREDIRSVSTWNWYAGWRKILIHTTNCNPNLRVGFESLNGLPAGSGVSSAVSA